MLEKSLQSEAICSALVPRQGKSGIFWGAGVARMAKMKKVQKRRLFGCIVLSTRVPKWKSRLISRENYRNYQNGS